MDPDDWLDQNQVHQMLTWAAAHPKLNSGFVHSAAGRLCMPSGGQGEVFLRDGDLRVVTDANGENKSVSHNLGFNLSAKHIVADGRVMSLGGRGFWDGHAKLVEFMERTGEWELVVMEKGPECVTNSGTWYNSANREMVAIDEKRWGRSTNDEPDVVWTLDLKARKWSILGKVNPQMTLFMRGPGFFVDLEDYAIWMGGHQTAVVRKSDLHVVLSPEWDYQQYAALIEKVESSTMWMMGNSGNRFQMWSMDASGNESGLVDWDVARAFETRFERNDPIDWVVPFADNEEALFASGFSDIEEETSPRLGLWMLVLFMVGGLAYAAGIKSGAYRKQAGAFAQPQEGALKNAQVKAIGMKTEQSSVAKSMLATIQQLENNGEGVMSTEELNLFLDLGVDVSSESKRAKRAQFIRDVNRIYQMRHGEDMIVREKDLNDRRRTIYVIHPRSNNA